jgi:glutathione reductase (NADPH)
MTTPVNVVSGFLGSGETVLVAQLRRETERIGVTIHTGVEVRQIERTGERLRVVYEEGGSERAAEAERVVNGAGRVANVDGLDLAAGAITAQHWHIVHDP